VYTSPKNQTSYLTRALFVGRLDNGLNVVWLDEEGECVIDPLLEGPRPSDCLDCGGMASCDGEYARRLSEFYLDARCSPQDKVSVVDAFVGLGFTTMMCGDGGKDCGALKAAHIGVALSDSDASLVAPFTS
jgi:hypothetical protein